MCAISLYVHDTSIYERNQRLFINPFCVIYNWVGIMTQTQPNPKKQYKNIAISVSTYEKLKQLKKKLKEKYRDLPLQVSYDYVIEYLIKCEEKVE